MNDPRKRAQWTSHMADEAVALDQQQTAAGATHQPVRGAGPHTPREAAEHAADAVQAEQDRCVAVAQAWTSQDRLVQAWPGLDSQARTRMAELAAQIARDIRRG